MDEDRKAARERASENNFINQLAERFYETGYLDQGDTLFVLEALMKDRGLMRSEEPMRAG